MRYERPKSWFWVGWKTVPFLPFVDQSSPNLVGMYGSDLSCKAVFRSTISCSNPEIFAIKSQNGVVENYVFRPQIFGEKDPQNQMHTFYAYMGTHQAGKSGAIISPTYPDDIGQSTPDFWPILEFRALKIVEGRPIPSKVCISKHWSPSTNCKIFRGQRPLAPEIWAEIWASEKVDWIGRNACPIFRRLWTEVHHIW